MRCLLLFLLVFLFYSCGSVGVHSGKYVKLTNQDSLKSLSTKYQSPIWAIREVNPGKKFVAGEIVLIPQAKGFMSKGRAPSSSYRPGIYDHFFHKEGYQWPVPDSRRISSDYGHRWGKRHAGIDIPAKTGTNIVAANDGVVVYSGDEYSGFGNLIVIAHRDGTFTMYGHNHRNKVDRGDIVRKGQVIGLVGNTGRSTGSHLHFEVRRNGSPIDPNRYVASNE